MIRDGKVYRSSSFFFVWRYKKGQQNYRNFRKMTSNRWGKSFYESYYL